MLHLYLVIAQERLLQTAVEMPSVQSHSSVTWGPGEVGRGSVSFTALDRGVGFHLSICLYALAQTYFFFFFFRLSGRTFIFQWLNVTAIYS